MRDRRGKGRLRRLGFCGQRRQRLIHNFELGNSVSTREDGVPTDRMEWEGNWMGYNSVVHPIGKLPFRRKPGVLWGTHWSDADIPDYASQNGET